MFNGPLYRLFKIISSVSRGHIRFTDRFIRHISFQIEITRTAKNSGRSSTFRCLLSSEAFGLSRQTGFRKFPTEVSATKHAHAAHAHVHHHHCAAQLLHGCFLPFLEILRHFVDVGIVAPYCIFVKRFFRFLSFLTKFFSPRRPFCVFLKANGRTCGYVQCRCPVSKVTAKPARRATDGRPYGHDWNIK